MQNKGFFCTKNSYNVTETFDCVTQLKKRVSTTKYANKKTDNTALYKTLSLVSSQCA